MTTYPFPPGPVHMWTIIGLYDNGQRFADIVVAPTHIEAETIAYQKWADIEIAAVILGDITAAIRG